MDHVGGARRTRGGHHIVAERLAGIGRRQSCGKGASSVGWSEEDEVRLVTAPGAKLVAMVYGF